MHDVSGPIAVQVQNEAAFLSQIDGKAVRSLHGYALQQAHTAWLIITVTTVLEVRTWSG